MNPGPKTCILPTFLLLLLPFQISATNVIMEALDLEVD
jgi:hypothetical protein